MTNYCLYDLVKRCATRYFWLPIQCLPLASRCPVLVLHLYPQKSLWCPEIPPNLQDIPLSGITARCPVCNIGYLQSVCVMWKQLETVHCMQCSSTFRVTEHSNVTNGYRHMFIEILYKFAKWEVHRNVLPFMVLKTINCARRRHGTSRNLTRSTL